jgi:hypothetical protein
MLANNFGLLGNPVRARWILKKLLGITSAGAVILAESTDPYAGATAPHKRYHKRNRARGRMPGQLRLRVRYRQYQTPWFDYLLVSKTEMKRIVSGSGWHIERFIDSGEAIYIAVLKKEL